VGSSPDTYPLTGHEVDRRSVFPAGPATGPVRDMIDRGDRFRSIAEWVDVVEPASDRASCPLSS